MSLVEDATLIIDGQALVVSTGKPLEAKTFHDLYEVFRKSVLQAGVSFNCIDIIFDRYYKVFIKSGTRTRHTKGTRPF